MKYYPCPSVSGMAKYLCGLFTVYQQTWNRVVLCKPCQKFAANLKRNTKKLVVIPLRCCPFYLFCQTTQKVAYNRTKYDINIIKQKYSRTVGNLEKEKNILTFGDDTPAKQVLVDAIKYFKTNWKKTNDNIVKIMMELQLEGENGNDVKNRQCQSIVVSQN